MSQPIEPPPILARMRSKHWVGLIFLCLVNAVVCQFAFFRHLYPGQWCGPVGMFPMPLWAFFVLAVTMVVGATFIKGPRPVLPVAILILSTIAPCLLPFRPDRGWRFGVEKPDYLRAAGSGSKFGDQHEGEIGGRKLIYWRWTSWGIDNAIGVIYDPQDRLLQGHFHNMDRENPDFKAFDRITGGHLGDSKRMGDGLYLVTHT